MGFKLKNNMKKAIIFMTTNGAICLGELTGQQVNFILRNASSEISVSPFVVVRAGKVA
jgi:hypothetical protein